MASICWYRVSNQLDIFTHDSPDLTLKANTKYWIEVVSSNRIHTTSISKNDFELYEYNVFNNVIEPCQIIEHYLSVVKIYDRIANSWGTVVCFEIEDANQIKRKFEFGGCQIVGGKEADEAIIDGISFMKQYGSNKTWDVIDLKIENIKQKQEIEILKDKIRALEAK